MIITNLLTNMVLLGSLDIIQTNTPAFQEYAYHAMFTNAQAITAAWHLDESLISTNKVTRFEADPTIVGVHGYIEFEKRYHFAYDWGIFSDFTDFQNDIVAAKTPNVKANDAIFEQWLRATNLLTMKKARQLAASSFQAIGVPGDFRKPNQSEQMEYERKDGKTYPLPLYSFEWSDDKLIRIYRMEVSGVNSNVAHYFSVGPSVRLRPPTNYFDLLGLPPKPVFVRKILEKTNEYEIILDTANWHQP
jgi:hypothetical protein